MLSLAPALVLASVAAASTSASTQPATVKAGVERWRAGDYAAAVAAWLPFAAQGDADAAFNLGQAYKLGRGVTKDPAVARDYYRRAAAKGHLPAQANLGIALFQAGDKLEAVRWLKQAADRGEQRAQYVLGIAAYNGDGTPKNTGLAYGYLLRAQASGLPQATTALASIEPSLAPDARAAGRAMADSLAAGNGVPSALAAASTPRSGPVGVQRPGTTPAPGIVANAVTSVRSALGIAPSTPARMPPADASAASRPRTGDVATVRQPSPTPTPVTAAATPTRQPAARPSVPPTPRPVTEVAETAPRPTPIPASTHAPAPAPVAVGPQNPNPPAAIAEADIPAGRPAAVPPAPIAASPPATTPPARPVVAEAPPKPAPKPKPLTWRVQLGAFSSKQQADTAWASIKTSQASAIGKAKPIFDSSGSVVKFQIGPFANKDAARDACAKLAFAGKACFVTQG